MGQKKTELVLEHEGVIYRLSPEDFTAVDDLEMHRATGVTLSEVFFGRRLTLFTLAALVWRYRVTSGETSLSYLDVARTFRFDSLSVDEDDDVDGEPAPEA